MLRRLLERLAQAIVTFALTMILLFALMRLAPGDPLARLSDDRPMNEAERHHLERIFGLDQPIGRQLAHFGWGAIRGDLGTSIEYYPTTVAQLILARLGPSLLLAVTVLLINATLGVWLGVLQARRRGTWIDRWLERLSLAGYALPTFWIGLMLVGLFAIRWPWLPAGQMSDPFLAAEAGWVERAIDIGRHLILPAMTLSIVTLGATMRYQRNAMLEVLPLDYVVAARARGLAERWVVWRHAWRNALFPILTLMGLWIPTMVTGAVFVETVFNWPGLGSLAAGAIATRDYPVLMGTSMITMALVLVAAIFTDLLQRRLDPRTGVS